jgi:hypothetical protein
MVLAKANGKTSEEIKLSGDRECRLRIILKPKKRISKYPAGSALFL